MKKKKTHAHGEHHRAERAGWLRAAVLGADDGVVSTASLMIGVASTTASTNATLIAGVAGLVAGAMSMAAGEYVSVGSQRDAELADIRVERRELSEDPEAELKELAMIYQKRGLDPELSMKVAEQLMARNPLAAHVRDELGLDPKRLSRPIQAAIVSAISFASLAMVPIVALLVTPHSASVIAMGSSSLVALAGLGALGARLGGASITRGALRVIAGGALAMAFTAFVGRVLHVAGVG